MNPTDTLSRTYATATLKMADGTEVPVLVRRVPRGDGSFGMIVVDDATIEFEKWFAGAETIPNDIAPVDTSVLVRREPASVSQEQSTRIKMYSADLVMFLGDPDRIIAQGGFDPEKLAHLKAHRQSSTLARRICLNIRVPRPHVARQAC